jgi:predicted SpoU family rRNA methylase
VVASVINGEAIPVIQNRVADAGFTDLHIIPFGADKIFIRSFSDADVMKTVKEASEFFNLLMTNIVHWDKTIVSFHRGCMVETLWHFAACVE